MQNGSSRKPKLSPGAEAWLDDHLKGIRAKIIQEAEKLASNDLSLQAAPKFDSVPPPDSVLEIDPVPIIEPMTIAEAAKHFAPGRDVYEFRHRHSIIPWIFTFVCAALTILFGILGLYVNEKNAQSWLDISKIFAGAIVGAAGASAAAIREK